MLKLLDPRKLQDIGEESARHAFIRTECMVTDAFGEALKHFGYSNLERDLSLAMLLERWKEATQDRQRVPTGWIEELTAEMYRAIDNRPAKPK